MELHHEFTVPVPVDEAWRALLDIERVAPCMPGATVEDFDGQTVAGKVKVKVGPIGLTYGGTAVFEDQDESAHRLVLTAGGKETHGQGTARATVTGTLTEAGDGGTMVSVHTDLTVTGRPAQFGRGVLGEVGDKLVGQFADRLSRQLTEAHESAAGDMGTVDGTGTAGGLGAVGAGAEAAEGAVGADPYTGAHLYDDGPAHLRLAPPLPETEPIDLLKALGVPIAKRVGAVVLGALVAVTGVVVWRRLRSPWSAVRNR
ncbi:SRPBCC family protein [Streptomyces sp. NPDC058001]|uniref:SRPBCC family protein n=1 Tax=Streptomyces sp. NPDC058001 TaxID=3346300 RepID=UPI0036ED8D0A